MLLFDQRLLAGRGDRRKCRLVSLFQFVIERGRSGIVADQFFRRANGLAAVEASGKSMGCDK
jgi:hypothetical protein